MEKKPLFASMKMSLLNQKERTYTYYLGGGQNPTATSRCEAIPMWCVCVYDYNKVFLVLYKMGKSIPTSAQYATLHIKSQHMPFYENGFG